MAAFYAQYPASISTNPSIGTNGAPAPTQSTEVAGINPSGNLQPLQTDATGRLLTSPSTILDPSHVIVDSSALPLGASTEAKQDDTITELQAANVSLTSIDGKLTSPLTVTGPLTDTQLRATAVPVSGPLTDTELRATAVPVSLTSTTITGSVAVTGPLTDTELRATPVPVSGTVSTGGLTDAELRASAVPVSLTSTTITGSVAVTGPLTDTELRATPVPVSGTVSTGGLTDAELRATPVPVSGTVTANAGVDLNTSALNLEATQAAMSAKLPAVLGQTTMSASMAVALASDQSSIPVAATLSAETTKVIGTVNIAAAQTIANVTTVGTITNAVPTQSPVGRVKANDPVYNNYASTSVTTAAYVQLIASTSGVTNRISIFDSSGQPMILATGAAASEVNQLYVPPGGGEFDLAIPAGTRISIKALVATASSGFLLINVLT